MNKFQALADPSRRKIIEILSQKGELQASDIYEYFDVSPQAVSQHLKVLREAELVTVEKQAQMRLYRVNPAAVVEVETWARQLRQLWEERFDAIERILEREKDKENKKNEQE